jgi:hypothetical protein
LKTLAASNASDDLAAATRQRIIEDRWKHFRGQLEANSYNFLHLFEMTGIEEYFRTGIGRRSTPNPVPVSPADRLSEIDETVRLLQSYHPRLQVSFYKGPLPYAMLIRPDNCAFIDSKSDLANTLNGIFVTYPNIVNNITNAFYDCWNGIPAEQKSADYIVGTYEKLKTLVG